jgi:hypothetical protein
VRVVRLSQIVFKRCSEFMAGKRISRRLERTLGLDRDSQAATNGRANFKKHF